MVNFYGLKKDIDMISKHEEDSYDCECVDCNHTFKSESHCRESTCPECGSKNVRRSDRPSKANLIKAEVMVDPATPEDDEKDTVEKNMENDEFTVHIEGEIGNEVTSEMVNKKLELADGRDVTFKIASPGGSIFEGIEIHNVIRNYKGKTIAKISGMAASMASYIPLAADKVMVEDNAVYMIHKGWTLAMGNAEDLHDQADILQDIDEMLANEYVKKTGTKKDKILQMMSDETWLMGEEIVKAGFADEMIKHDEKKEPYTESAKEGQLAEAKSKVKNTLDKYKKERMKSDIEKIKQNRIGGISKMSKENSIEYVSKLSDKAIEDVKKILGDLQKLSKEKAVTPEDIGKIAVELESAITMKKSDDVKPTEPITPPATEPESKPDPAKVEDTPAPTPPAEPVKPSEDVKPVEPVVEEPKKEDVPITPTEPVTPEEKPAEEPKPAEDSASKQSEIEKTYQEVASEAVSKMKEVTKLYKLEQEKNESMTRKNLQLSEEVSKFKDKAHNVLLDTVVNEISKFKDLQDDAKLKKREEISKMSDEALGIMKAEFEGMNISKLEEENNDTEPSQNLEGNKPEDVVSKMKKNKEQCEVDSAINRAFH